MTAAFTSFVARIRSWFPKAKAHESSESRWKCAGNNRGPTLSHFDESIFSSGPAVFSKHFPANNCVLSDRGTNVNFILQRKNWASERVTAKVMQAACELESEALGAFALLFFFLFLNRHKAVFHSPPKLDSFSASLLEIPPPAPLRQQLCPVPLSSRAPVVQ